MEVTDWRSVSQHYITELVGAAVEKQQLHTVFKPTVLVAANEDALPVSRILKNILKSKAKLGVAVPILTHTLELYDEETNPLNPHRGYWGNNSFSGHRILVVDKADNSRSTIASFLSQLQQHTDGQKAVAESSQQAWIDPAVGVFVLHNKRRPKAADLPAEVMDGRYFVGEETDNCQIAYPFNVHDTQPTAHGDHASLEDKHLQRVEAPARGSSPPPTLFNGATDIRAVSQHHIEEILERAVDEQQIHERFNPTLLLAVNDDALAPARLLRHYLRFKSGADAPILTSKLELYKEDPYVMSTESWAHRLQGHNILLVDKADATRTTLAKFITTLQQHIAAQRDASAAAGQPWQEPVLGVFVLHNKMVAKHADLPADILNGRYFYGEMLDNVQISYPFHVPGN